MIYVGLSQIEINLKDKVGRTITNHKFDPSIKFVVEKVDVIDLVFNSILPPHQHDMVNFQFSYEKKLSPYEFYFGFLVSYLIFIYTTIFRFETIKRENDGNDFE